MPKEVRPYIFLKIEEMAFEICQKEGWFRDYETSLSLTEDDKKTPHWRKAIDIANYSYDFWSEALL